MTHKYLLWSFVFKCKYIDCIQKQCHAFHTAESQSTAANRVFKNGLLVCYLKMKINKNGCWHK